MTDILSGQEWYVHHGDCIPHMAEMPAASVDFSVFSPPFPSLFAYTDLAEDIGNSEDFKGEAKLHLSFFFKQLARIIKPGRVCVVHCMQIPILKRTGEGRGTIDFRGLLIRLGQRSGLTFDYDWIVSKNPQVQAQRSHSHALQFASLERDRSVMFGAHGDYLIKFRAPGDNKTKINDHSLSKDDWIRWAESCWSWTEIRQTDTLNVSEGRGEDDTKHICPLQLGVINRLVRLFSMPGEIVFSPFAGIGSEGYEALKLGRRFYGCEIKPEYLAAAMKNLARAVELRDKVQMPLFAGMSA